MSPDVTLSETFSSLLVTCAFKGTLFLLFTGLVALSTSSASRRHFVWITSFLGLGLLVILELFLPWRLAVLPIGNGSEWFASAQPWLFPIWIAGLGLFALRSCVGLLSLVFIERRSQTLDESPWDTMVNQCRERIGVHRRVRLLRFPGRIMPMTWGVLRSFIVLPTSAMAWSPGQLTAVLMHEMAHIRRSDFLATLLRDVVSSFFWFHPLVWWAAREMDDDREEASDDVVVAAGHGAVPYAEHLAAVATGNLVSKLTVPRPRVALANRPLVMRVRSILAPWKSRHPITWVDRLQLSAAVVTIALFTGIWAPRDLAVQFTDMHSSIAAQEAMTSFELKSQPRPPIASTEGWLSTRPGLSTVGWTEVDGIPFTPADRKSFPLEMNKANSRTGFGMYTADWVNVSAQGRWLTFPQFGSAITLPPEYSTTPPDQGSKDVPAAFDFEATSDIIPNLGNVALNGVTEFAGPADTTNYANIPPDLPQDVVADFLTALRELEQQVEDLFGNPKPPATTIVFDSGLFQTAGAIISEPMPLVASVELPPNRLVTEKLFASKPPAQEEPELPSKNQKKGTGLETAATIVKSNLTGARHLGISFWRKPDSTTAKYWIEASRNMEPGSWEDNQDLFILAKYGLREDGRQVVVVVLRDSMDQAPFRYMRVRSTH